MSTKSNLQPFLFHGVDLEGEHEAQGDCPFCGKEGHFYVSQTGQWSCKRCDESGNTTTFLTALYRYSVEQTTEKDLLPVSQDRSVSISTLVAWGVCVSITTGDVLLPVFNHENKLTNLFKASAPKYRPYSTPKTSVFTPKTQPFRPLLSLPEIGRGVDWSQLPETNSNTQTSWVCEGPWDGMAWYEALSKTRQNGKLVRTTDHTKSLLAASTVIATPGANVFRPEWFTYLRPSSGPSGQVSLLFDNDHPKKHPASGKTTMPGWDGMQRILRLASTLSPSDRPTNLQLLNWESPFSSRAVGHNPDLADGYDLRDLLQDHTPAKAVAFVLDHLVAVKLPTSNTNTKTFKGSASDSPTSSPSMSGKPTGFGRGSANDSGRSATASDETEAEETHRVDPLPRSTFRSLVKDFEGEFHVTQTFKDTLACMLATNVSTILPGEQLWMRIIGPPGSGKTTLAEAMSPHKACFPSSIQTGFHSGFVTDGDKSDSSLLPRMDGKTVIIKDGDTLLQSSGRDRLLAELRDIYDRTSRAHYRNREERIYEGLSITFLLCGTDSLRTLNRSFLGERFLDIEILEDGSQTPYLDRALDKTYAQLVSGLGRSLPENADQSVPEPTLQLKRCTVGYMDALRESLSTLTPPTLDTATSSRIKALAQFLALMRARVPKGEDAQRPRVELATRLVAQLTKLALCLAITLNRKSLDGGVLRIVRKVVLDTASGYQLDITQALARNSRTVSRKGSPGKDGRPAPTGKPSPSSSPGLTAEQLAHSLRLSTTAARNTLYDMQSLGIAQRAEVSNNSGQRGKLRHVWQLTDFALDLHQQALGKV